MIQTLTVSIVPKKIATVIVSFSLLLTCIALTAPASHAAEEVILKRILVLYGHLDIGPWERNFNDILLRSLPPDGVSVTPEYIPLIDANDEQLNSMAEAIRQKYNTMEFDLLVATQTEANAFLHQWGEIIAPNAARLYVLPSDALSAEIAQSGSGIVISSAVQAAAENTVNIMPSLLPGLERIFILGGVSEGDRAYLSRLEEAVSNSSLETENIYLRGLPPGVLVQELANSPDNSPDNTSANSAILVGTFDLDSDGNMHRGVDVISILSEQTSIPIFTVFGDLVGAGALGGNVTSSTLYAEQTVEHSLAILSAGLLLETDAQPTVFQFDAEQLERFAIDQSLLPEGSVLINYHLSPLRQYLTEIVAGIVVILLQLILIIALINTGRRRRQAEKELREALRMESLGNLAGGIAHDFNNILMAIEGNAELANYSLELEPSLVRDHLSKISEASARAKNLVNQILRFSRSSQEEFHSSINLRKLLEETISMVRASSPIEIDISLSNPDDLWTIDANEAQLQQVVMNLCTNAIQAASGPGLVSITASNQHIRKAKKLLGGTLPPGDYVVILVSDNGAGISQKNISHVFEPFFTTKPHGKGTGLGLALVYGIIKQHGGYINLQSELGQFTNFTLYFQSSGNAPEEELSEIPEQFRHARSELILLVDDDEMVIDANEKILQRLGYKTEAFTNSIEALRQFKLNPNKFDLIFTDLSMPEMDGVRLISNIRSLTPGIPAILCTGYSGALEQTDTESFDNLTILEKPCSLEKISLVVNSVLAGARSGVHS